MKDLEIHLQEVQAGRMNRREFLGRATAMGLSVAAASSLLSQSAFAATPKRGGDVVFTTEYTGAEETFNPTKMTNSTDIQRAYQVYNRLTNLDRNLQVVPNLAVEWESANDATEWTFVLREGVEFHNGKTLTAKDIIYSLNQHIKEGSESPSKPLLEPIVEMKADGPNVLKFTLNSGNADFPTLLGHDYHTSIVAEGWKEGDEVNGTGPYKLVEFTPSLKSVTVRHENYWKEDAAYVDSFTTQGIADSTARTNALRAGDIDIAQIDPRVADLMSREAGIKVVSTPSGAHFLWVMMCDREPTNDLNFRLAMKHAVNRNSLIDKVLRGHGSIGNDFPVNPAIPMYCKDIPQHDYDPDKARFYWKKTGLSGIEIAASTAAGDHAIDASIILQEQAKTAGIEITVKRVPDDGYWNHTWMKVPMHVSNWNSRPTADLILTIAHQSAGSWNETQWKNERFDELLVMGRIETDHDKRYEIYCEAGTLLHDQGGTLLPFFSNFLEAHRNRIQNFNGSAAFAYGAGWPYEEIWVDESLA